MKIAKLPEYVIACRSQVFFIVILQGLHAGAQVAWAVEVAVGDGFHDVMGEDVVCAFEVGDGAGDF